MFSVPHFALTNGDAVLVTVSYGGIQLLLKQDRHGAVHALPDLATRLGYTGAPREGAVTANTEAPFTSSHPL